jgi:phage-related protein
MSMAVRIAVAVMLVCGAASPLAAQQEKPPKPPPAKSPASPKQQKAAVKRLNENPAKELDRFTNMSPEAREKELSKLPPQRRAQFEQRLARYERMTPEQQERFKEQLEIMRKLPKDRQQAVKQKIQDIRALPFAERRKALTGDDFKQNFSPDEQKVVRAAFPGVKNLE